MAHFMSHENQQQRDGEDEAPNERPVAVQKLKKANHQITLIKRTPLRKTMHKSGAENSGGDSS